MATALKADPQNPYHLGNYAGFLLGKGRDAKGLPMLDRAIAALSPESEGDLQTEFWFYALAHRAVPHRPEALAALKTLILKKDSRSPA